jgi:RNA polymerase-binding transcription factor
MRKRDREHFRRFLQGKLTELQAASNVDLRQRVSQPHFDLEESRDEGDEAQRTASEDMQTSHAEQNAALLRQVAAALQRMADGDYGRCVDCGNEIEIERLRAVPWAFRCTADQEAHELEARQHPPSL